MGQGGPPPGQPPYGPPPGQPQYGQPSYPRPGQPGGPPPGGYSGGPQGPPQQGPPHQGVGMPQGTPWTGGGGPGGPQPSYEVEPERRGPRWLIAGLAAVLVLAVGGGAWAFASLRSSGSQPEQVLPANALAYVRVDLDPSAGQKLEALEFARKFPEASKRLGEGDDLRKALFEALQSGDDDLKDVDYATDIEPWLGKRLGVAAVPGNDGKEPDAVAAIQVTNEEKARAGVKKLLPEGDKTGYAFADDYMIIADTQAEADQAAKSAGASPLAESQQFRDDMDAIGESGVLSFWVDAAKLTELKGDAPQLPIQMAKAGRFVGALSFDNGAAQLEAVARGTQIPSLTKSGIKLGELPSTTVAGISVAGAGAAVQKAWPNIQGLLEQTGQSAQLDSFLRAADQQFGIKLPADLVTLLGTEFTLAVDERGLADVVKSGTTGEGEPALPQAGFRSTTDPAKAKQLMPKLEQLIAASGAPVKVGTAVGSDGLAVGTTQSYADELVKGGNLGSTEAFKAALPNADGAQFGLFVDLDKVEQLLPSSMPADQRANLKALKAVGLSGSTTSDGGSFTIRVVAD